MHTFTEHQLTALHTSAHLLPADPSCPQSMPVLAAAGFRIGFQVQEDGTVWIGVDAEQADAALSTTDGRLRGVEVDVPGCARIRRRSGPGIWARAWRRLRGLRRVRTTMADRLFRMQDTALEQLIQEAHSELHRRAVLALAQYVGEVCAERGWPAPAEVRSASVYDDYDSKTEWSPNGVVVIGVDRSRREVDFGRREVGESFATEMVRAYLAEATEHQEPPFDAELVVTLLPSPAFHLDRYRY
ncbi:hypothetical protein ACGF12_22600 [Kitasatospora sp. NPDC048296]|uniref:hypothetical protein n=1 Tax=Kitasatospora sp. NPDC048296 TaxID=3364048 RepID=UPI00371F1CD6